MSAPPRACAKRLRLALSVPRHSRIVRVSVFHGSKRLARRHGRRLRHVSFRPPRARSFHLAVTEVTAHGRRIRLAVAYRDCRRVERRHRRRARNAR